MAIEINLLGKKRKKNSNKVLSSWVFVGFLSIFSLYFFGTSIYVVYQYYRLNNRLSDINLEMVSLSDQIRSKNTLVTKYVLVKGILDNFENLQKSKFQYKEYMDQLVGIFPRDSVLKNVDFSTKGWVIISLQISDYATFEQFEEKLSVDTSLPEILFDSIYVESVSRDKEGKYTIKLRFAIKKNA